MHQKHHLYIGCNRQDGDSIKAMGVLTPLRWLPFIAKATPSEDIPPAVGRHGLLYCASLNPIAAAAVQFLAQQVNFVFKQRLRLFGATCSH